MQRQQRLEGEGWAAERHGWAPHGTQTARIEIIRIVLLERRRIGKMNQKARAKKKNIQILDLYTAVTVAAAA